MFTKKKDLKKFRNVSKKIGSEMKSAATEITIAVSRLPIDDIYHQL